MKPNPLPTAGTPAVPAAGSGRNAGVFRAGAPLKPVWMPGLALLGVAALHPGFLYAPLSWLVRVWLGGLFAPALPQRLDVWSVRPS